MAEYIEREATCKDCVHYNVCYHIEHYSRELETDKPCEQFKSADVVEVVHAYWDKDPVTGVKFCSDCKAPPPGDAELDKFYESDYCPCCGAKMDGERRSEK